MLRVRLWRAAAPFCILAVLMAGLATRQPFQVGALHDDAVYVMLAKALATGRGYAYLNLPGAPAATHFPPGYPIFLSLLWRLDPAFPSNVALFKLANIGFLGAIAGLLYLLLSRHLEFGRISAAFIATGITLSTQLLTLTALVLSEPAFLTLVLAALLAAAVTATRGDRRMLFSAALLAGAATLVRTQGVVLIAALLLPLHSRGGGATSCSLAR